MRSLGVHHATATACARAWIRNEDFLLAELPGEGFTPHRGQIRHTSVGQSCQARTRRPTLDACPRTWRAAICTCRSCTGPSSTLPRMAVAPSSARTAGATTAYAEGFRKRWCPKLHITTEAAGHPTDVFRPGRVRASRGLSSPSCAANLNPSRPSATQAARRWPNSVARFEWARHWA